MTENTMSAFVFSSFSPSNVHTVNGITFFLVNGDYYINVGGQFVKVQAPSHGQQFQAHCHQFQTHGHQFQPHNHQVQPHNHQVQQQGGQKGFVCPPGFSKHTWSSGPAGKYIPSLHVSRCPLSPLIRVDIGEHDTIYARNAGHGWVEVQYKNATGFMQV